MDDTNEETGLVTTPEQTPQQEEFQQEEHLFTPGNKTHCYNNGDTFTGFVDREGHRQGHGVYRERKSGSTYEGEWKDSKRHEKGVLITSSTKYDGQFQLDKKHGHGTLILNDLSSYNGQFSNGFFHGKGMLCDGDGRVYRGDFERGLRDGLGEETLPDGSFYAGEYKKGKRHGLGTHRDFEDGNIVYSGQWANDLMHGEGLLFENNNNFQGTFVRGQRTGHCVLTKPEGVIHKGKWLRDVPTIGNWMVTYKDTSIFSGHATLGPDQVPTPNGFGTMKYRNGDLYTGEFIDGKREGMGLCVFQNGDRWEGAWSNDAIGTNDKGLLTFKDGTSHQFGAENVNK